MFQAARWVAVKEEAAKNIITTVAEYMLCQRVKKELFKTHADYLQVPFFFVKSIDRS